MAKVNIILEKHETIEEAQEMLKKALELQETHSEEAFDDPAMVDVENYLMREHAKIYAEMIAEINETLGEDYLDGDF